MSKKLLAVSASLDLQETVGLYVEQNELSLDCLFTVKTAEFGVQIRIVYRGESFAGALEHYKYEREMRDFKDHLIGL